MSWTKRQFVIQAFDSIGFGSDEFDIGVDSLQSALVKMEAMVAMWAGKGINIKYPLASEPENASLDTETNVPSAANEAIYLNLALRIAGSHGKTITADLRAGAKYSYKEMMAFAVSQEIPTMQMPETTPLGAGYKSWRSTRRPFVSLPDDDPLSIDKDGKLDFREK